MDMETLKAIVKALRTPANPERIVYKDGKIARTEPAGKYSLSDMLRRNQYGKYKTMNDRMGESSVSYEEFK